MRSSIRVRPRLTAASTSLRPSSNVAANGFSTSTCLPASSGHRDGQVGGGRGGDGDGTRGRVGEDFVERAGHPHRRVAAEDPMRAFGIQVAEVFQAEPGSRLRIADQVGPQ